MAKVRVKDLFEFERPLVDPGTVWVRTAPRWFGWFWHEPFIAIALPWAIYLRRDAEHFENGELRRLLSHELVHIAQWRQMGVRRFLVSYVGDYVGGRRAGMNHLDAYGAISLERDARLRGEV